ncbi:MAG: hypothetical protein J6X56_01290 [Ruminococcus sp.]|nr:hypothetical protein [Ruminococcus sp.]
MNKKRTVFSYFIGNVVQVVINYFLPLLFIMLMNEYGILMSSFCDIMAIANTVCTINYRNIYIAKRKKAAASK